MSLSPLQQELAISTVKVLVIFSALMTLFSLMTYVERRVLAFMQFRLGPNRTGPFGLLQPVADGIKLTKLRPRASSYENIWAEERRPPMSVYLLLAAQPAITIP